jgi:hypothetical protein
MKYRVICHVGQERQFGQEFLGEAYGREYDTANEAQRVADVFQDEVEDCGLHPETEYSVEEALY